MESNQETVVTPVCVQEYGSEPTDILFECKNGFIAAHKNVLAVSSNYFEGILNREEKSDIIAFKDVSTQAVEIIISYLYIRDTPNLLNCEFEALKEVLVVAHRILLNELFHECLIVVATNVTCENVVDVWSLIEKYDTGPLETRLKIFVLNHMEKLLGNASFLHLNENQIRKLICFVKHGGKTTRVNIECFVVFVVKWANEHLQFVGDEEKREIRLLLENDPFLPGKMDSALSPQVFGKWLDFEQCSIAIHAFLLDGNTIESCVYTEADDKWGHLTIHLRNDIATRWYPAVSTWGEEFFFGISKEKKYVALYYGSVYHGPKCNTCFQGLANNSSNNEEIYFKDSSNCYVIFNFVTKTWRTLNFDTVKDCGQILLATKKNIYFECQTGSFVDIYSKMWRREIKPQSNMVGIKCKCLSEKCNEKLFFVKEGGKLMIYNCLHEEWINVCESVDSTPVLANCDQSLVLLKGRGKELHLFSPFSNIKWVTIKYPWDHHDWSKVIVDFSFKCHC